MIDRRPGARYLVLIHEEAEHGHRDAQVRQLCAGRTLEKRADLAGLALTAEGVIATGERSMSSGRLRDILTRRPAA